MTTSVCRPMDPSRIARELKQQPVLGDRPDDVAPGLLVLLEIDQPL